MKAVHRLARLGAFVIAFALYALFGSGGPAAAQTLFQPATAADASAAAAQAAPADPLAVRQRLVRVDRAVLSNHLAPSSADTASDRAERAQKLDGIVRLNLFPDATSTFRRTDVSAQSGSGFVWEGTVRGQAFHEALLIIDNGQISGRVQLKDRIFRIDPVDGQVHRITELDSAKFPPEAAPQELRGGNAIQTPDAAPEEDEQDLKGKKKKRAKSTIKVLVAYTPTARNQAGGAANIVNQIKQAIALANQAYMRGSIPIKLVLAGPPVLVNYNEGSNIFTNLNDLTAGAQFANLRNLRNTRGADLVSLFRSFNAAFCGVAWMPANGIMPSPGPATADTGFSIMVRDCIANLSFHHELGHNMGLQHDRVQYKSETGTNPNKSFFNFGFVNLKAKIRTVLAYNTACAAKGFNCTRVNWFSSPVKKAQPGNVLIGIAKGKKGAADNTTRLKQTRTAVSNYR